MIVKKVTCFYKSLFNCGHESVRVGRAEDFKTIKIVNCYV